jgi:hypothetical protein
MQRRRNIRGATGARMALDSAVQGRACTRGKGVLPAHRAPLRGMVHGIMPPRARSVADQRAGAPAGQAGPGGMPRRATRGQWKPLTDGPRRGSGCAARPNYSLVTAQ